MEWLLHWAYAREKVHLANAPGMSAWRRPGFAGRDSSAAIGVGGLSANNLGFEAPADAYTVERVVALQLHMAAILRRYAVMGVGAHPDWTPHPVIWVDHGPVANTLHIAPKGKRYICPFRTFNYRGDLPAIVAERRRVYAAWAVAMRAVHRLLSAEGVLVRHAVAPDVPSLAPWNDPSKYG